MVQLGNSWDNILKEEFNKEYYLNLREFLKVEYRLNAVYPSMYEIFNAFKFTPFEDVNVVLLGQDPYHGEGQAHGLAFSVKHGTQVPPSLANIYKELNWDIGCYIPNSGNLEKWAKQGVLLLNTVLTVNAANPNSHKNRGWENFTDAVIKFLNERETPIVFILWGNHARHKKRIITNPKHLILESAHPSPLSAQSGFFGCRHFSKTNTFLNENGVKSIDWQIE